MWGRVRDKVSKKNESLVCFTVSVFVPDKARRCALLDQTAPLPIVRERRAKAMCQMSEARLGDMPKSWLIRQNHG